MRKQALLALVLVFPFLLPHLSGQSVISARSGLVNFFEGVLFLDGHPLARKAGAFARMKDGSILLTQSGRAEVLLTPDTYLRIGENTSIRMISDSISDTQVELLAGSAILDSSKGPPGEFVRIIFRDTTIRILKPGHYRMDAEPSQLRVYQGEAEVAKISGDGKPVRIAASQLLPLDGASFVRRFTQGSDGLLDLWSEERGELIASKMVNSQTITDPLLDSGPGVPADLASYIGYVPLATMPGVVAPLAVNSFGYGYPYPGLVSYRGFPVSAFAPFPTASFLYEPRRYTSVFAGRPVVGGITAAPARSIFVPRPAMAYRPAVTLPPRVGGTIGARPGMAPGGRRR